MKCTMRSAVNQHPYFLNSSSYSDFYTHSLIAFAPLRNIRLILYFAPNWRHVWERRTNIFIGSHNRCIRASLTSSILESINHQFNANSSLLLIAMKHSWKHSVPDHIELNLKYSSIKDICIVRFCLNSNELNELFCYFILKWRAIS